VKTLAPRVSTLGTRLPAIQPGSWRATGASANDRGYTYAWQQARLRFLKQHPLCVACEERGLITAATVVDHRIPHRGDQALFWNKANWQGMCKPCHDSKTQTEDGMVDCLP
jgi:5-methylcytosine-specific restriction enzyme A